MPTEFDMLVRSDVVQPHPDGSRLLIGAERQLTGSAGTIELGTLAHAGASITATVTFDRSGGLSSRQTWTYECTVLPTSATGWRRIPWTSGSPILAPILRLEATETDGALTLRLGMDSEPGSVTATASVSLDVRGGELSWVPSAVTGGASSVTALWSAGGPTGPPIVTALPSSSYEGQEVLLRAATSPNPIYWHLRRIESNWIPVGEQVPLYSFSNASRSVSAGSAWSDGSVSTGGITCPAAGFYALRFGAEVTLGASPGNGAYVSVGASGSTSLLTIEQLPFIVGGGDGRTTFAAEARPSGSIASGALLRWVMGERMASTALNSMWMAVTPVRIPVP